MANYGRLPSDYALVTCFRALKDQLNFWYLVRFSNSTFKRKLSFQKHYQSWSFPLVSVRENELHASVYLNYILRVCLAYQLAKLPSHLYSLQVNQKKQLLHGDRIKLQ
jgi:hypothetical protein